MTWWLRPTAANTGPSSVNTKDDESSSLTWKDLSTFTSISFSHCRNITLGLVCTSADRQSPNLKKLHADKLSFCAGDEWRKLDADFFDRLHAYLEGKTKPHEPKSPRPHQQRAIDNAYDHFVVSSFALYYTTCFHPKYTGRFRLKYTTGFLKAGGPPLSRQINENGIPHSPNYE